MPSLVGIQQSAFVSGRDIVDNVLFMQEIMKNYHKEGGNVDVHSKLIFKTLMTKFNGVFLLMFCMSCGFLLG